MTPRTNEEWLRALRANGSEQKAALDDLREYLFRAALYFFNKSRVNLPASAPTQIEGMAEDLAQDALIEIINQLDEFRGESKFTTWAFRFVVNKALVELRRQQGKAISLEDILEKTAAPELSFPDEQAIAPERAAQREEIWKVIREIIDKELTERQRQALLSIAFEDVPIDELARVWNTNRNAVYKMLHDARLKLKKALDERGFDVGDILETFELNQ